MTVDTACPCSLFAQARLDTFEHVPGDWPEWKDLPCAEELAEWGFSYLGRADHIR